MLGRVLTIAAVTVLAASGAALAAPARGVARPPPAPPANHPPVRTAPDWLVKPSPDLMAAYYPLSAAVDRVSGRAVIACTVKTDGRLYDCVVVSETPADYGFGVAAVRMAANFQMRPATVDGKPVDASGIRIPLNFSLADGPPGGPGSHLLGPLPPPPIPTPSFAPPQAAAPSPAVAALTPPVGRLALVLAAGRRAYFLDLDAIDRDGSGGGAQADVLVMLDRAVEADPAAVYMQVHRLRVDCAAHGRPVRDLGARAFNADRKPLGYAPAPTPEGPGDLAAAAGMIAARVCDGSETMTVLGVTGAQALLSRR